MAKSENSFPGTSKQHKVPSQMIDTAFYLLKKFITHTSPYKYFQPSLLNKHIKASQSATIYLQCSKIRRNKLKACRFGNMINYIKKYR